ncbi:IclR family transcriptional regulator C-terminal domain-containing protein [Pendulispora albinea]|uniref:Helix-turn-helix domain-containing protein n=1 Tax=Pendulispora albinea TaxID=2741071 RepID=A0ABZ2M3T4_9BACT
MTGRKSAEFVESLDRGFRVIRAFDATHASMTLSEVAERADLTRAAARRFLHTLTELGYASFDGKRFALTARVLELGFAYLRSLRLPDIVTPYLRTVSETLEESCSASVLEGEDIVYIARVATRRIMSVDLGVGARLPAASTSMGRVLLAFLPPPEREERLARAELTPLTRHTVTSKAKLRAILDEVRERGYCVVDQELEEGLRSIAVPLIDHHGRVHAAINVSAQANRVGLDAMKRKFLPVLKKAADGVRAVLS